MSARYVDRIEWKPWCFVAEDGEVWPVELLPSTHPFQLIVREVRYLIIRAMHTDR